MANQPGGWSQAQEAVTNVERAAPSVRTRAPYVVEVIEDHGMLRIEATASLGDALQVAHEWSVTNTRITRVMHGETVYAVYSTRGELANA